MRLLFRGWFGKRNLQKREATIFYLSGRGDDKHSGTHPLKAWKTIARLNSARNQIRSGDQILFERGYQYPGLPFYLDPSWIGRIRVSAYGSGSYPVWPDLETEEQRLK